ncbi:Beta-lactamase-related protein [Lasiodiplodia theobromae]|nr:Beta-lactamase-related protein [Lasiodiplodia theobromae]
MNDVLPSYEAANTRDYWSIIARYISSADLCSAALVCKQWAAIFTRQLWGNPASHFGVENDVVYVALVRFRRTIRWARLSTRELTHTLHLPPAHAEIYDGPHAEWLRDILEYLPRLQSLIVYGLPFFDHGALITLRRPSNPRLSSLSDSLRRLTYDFPQFWLRYLDASACSNATYSGLAEALQHFPALLYLDLSRTKSAKGADVLSVLKHCHSLRILKLRGLGLKDAEIEALATAVKTRLKSLDVRNNQLTDASARILLDNCFSLRKPWPPRRPDGGPLSASSETVDSPASPSSPAMRHPFVFDQYANEDLDRVLRAKLVGEFAGNAFINDAYADGITHLYISDNNITVEGVSGLLHSKRLHVLDAGTVARGLTRKPRPPSLLSFEEADGPAEEFAMPGAEKLSPIIKKFAAGRMTYLRINHAVVTEETATADLAVGRVEMEGDLGIYAPSSAQELDGFNEVHEAPTDGAAVHEMPAGDQVLPAELPATEESQVFELPGDFPSKPAVVIDPPPPSTPPPPPPEPQPQPDDDDAVATEEQLLHGTEKIKLSEAEPPASLPSDDGSSAPEPLATLQAHDTQRRRRASSLAVDDRRARLDFRQSNEHHLHPGMLPALDTLVLTDVPREVESPAIVKRLTQFIADCAEETHLARLAARGAYALPPGRDRQLAEREFARGVFGLRRVVLEMEPVGVVKKRKVGAWRQYPSKSSTEDPDSEAFWAAAERDFSFFGDEECGVPSLEPGGRSLPPLMAGMSSEKVVILPEAAAGPVPVLVQHEARRRIDVCAELTRFRKERRAAYQAALLARGGGGGEEEGPEVEGYWEGEIQVVRPPPRTVEGEVGGGGEVDCYGNYFEKGYNYR